MRSVIPALVLSLGSALVAGAPARADDADRVYKKAVPGVVWIRNYIGKSAYTGTGFLVDRKKKLIITNHHVAQREARVDAFFPAPDGRGAWMTRPSYYTDNLAALKKAGYYAEGALVAYDPSADLAVYKVSPYRTRPTSSTSRTTIRTRRTSCTSWGTRPSGICGGIAWPSNR